MCGIAGIYSYHYAANPIDMAELRRIRERMAARGPDGAGEWCSDDRRVGLGHRRLAIIDLSERGAQPMASADGKIVVTCNGEIYNYRELRRELEAKGHVFRTETDTEVLLQLYAAKGPRWSTICAACSLSRSGMAKSAGCCSPAIPMESSRCITRMTAGRCVSPRR